MKSNRLSVLLTAAALAVAVSVPAAAQAAVESVKPVKPISRTVVAQPAARAYARSYVVPVTREIREARVVRSCNSLLCGGFMLLGIGF